MSPSLRCLALKGFTNLSLVVAYTRYAFFEWGLIFLDVLYDSATELDFSAADLQVCENLLFCH